MNSLIISLIIVQILLGLLFLVYRYYTKQVIDNQKQVIESYKITEKLLLNIVDAQKASLKIKEGLIECKENLLSLYEGVNLPAKEIKKIVNQYKNEQNNIKN